MNNSLKENIKTLKEKFASSADLTIRNMKLSSQNSVASAVITIEGMCNKEVTAISVINPILAFDFKDCTADEIIDKIKLSVLASTEIVEFNTLEEAITFSTSGFAIVAVDGTDRMLAIGAQGFSFRSVSCSFKE